MTRTLAHDARLSALGMVGKVDERTRERAVLMGIAIVGGSINKKDGRVRIFVKGKFPGAHRTGYALRSRVVWWLNTGEVIKGFDIDIHHKDTDRTNDCFDNLEKLEHIEHTAHHNPRGLLDVVRICATCGGTFKINRWRLKDISRGTYCSAACYWKRPRTLIRVGKTCEACGAGFEVIPSHAERARFCSQHCSGKASAEARWHRS